MTTKASGGYLRPSLLILLGLGALALTLMMDYRFGKSLALDDDNQMLMGAVFLGIDIIVVGLACVNGNLYRDGYAWLGVPISAFIFFGAILAMTATIGFGSAQRLGKADAAIAQYTNAKAAALARNADAKAVRDETARWARVTAVEGATRSIRAQAQETLTKLALQPIQIEEVPEKTTSPDIQAEALVKMFDTLKLKTNTDVVQVALILGVAIFLTLSQSICFGLAAFFWPVREVKAAEHVAPAPAPTAVVVPIFNAPVKKSEPKKIESIEVEDLDDDDALVHALKPDVEKIHTVHNQVEQFLADCTYADPNGRITATEMYAAYEAWAQQNDKEILTSNRFGRICTSLNLARDLSDRRRNVYMGLEFIRGGTEAALAEAA